MDDEVTLVDVEAPVRFVLAFLVLCTVLPGETHSEQLDMVIPVVTIVAAFIGVARPDVDDER